MTLRALFFQDRLHFFLGAAFLILLLSIAVTLAATPQCLCDGLPGSQCAYCEAQDVDSDMNGHAAELDAALDGAHTEHHEAWVEAHRQFHFVERTDEDDRAYHREMEDAHRVFHEQEKAVRE